MTDDATRPEALPQVTRVQLIESGSRAFLELQVNIEGRDHKVALEISDLPKTESSSQAAGKALAKRVEALEKSAETLNQNIQKIVSVVNDIPGVKRHLRSSPFS